MEDACACSAVMACSAIARALAAAAHSATAPSAAVPAQCMAQSAPYLREYSGCHTVCFHPFPHLEAVTRVEAEVSQCAEEACALAERQAQAASASTCYHLSHQAQQ